MAEQHEEIISAVKAQVEAIAQPHLGETAGYDFPMGDEASASDNPAIHDFHTLQIAYPHVWASLTDKLLYEGLVNFYARWNQVKYGPEVEPPDLDPIDSPQDIEELDLQLRLFFAQGRENNPEVPLPDEVIHSFPGIDKELWEYIVAKGDDIKFSYYAEYYSQLRYVVQVQAQAEVERLRGEMQSAARLSGRTRDWERVLQTIKELREHLNEMYKFDVFAPGSYNYGLLVTYRQTWTPGLYQVGDLVATLPLAPGESRKFSAKRVVTKKRSIAEAENYLEHLRNESTKTSRAEAEITRRAALKASFQNTASEDATIGVVSGSNETVVAGETSQESARVKRNFREAVVKTAAEYKTERKLEVTTTSSEEIEETTSGEIRNPNNEITVTYLFWELQRQYTIQEDLHRVRPVIMVAQEVPAPHEVDEDWLIVHEWILRRVLLDDRFKTGLEYLTGTLAGDELDVSLKRQEFEIQRNLVGKLEGTVALHLRTREKVRQAVREAIENQADDQGFFEDVGEFLFGGSDDSEAAQAKVDAAERALEVIENDLTEARNALASASQALQMATDDLSSALRQQVNHRMEMDQLRAHVKDNILYYMHAIWDHEVPDQRYYRLYDLAVEVPVSPEGSVRLEPTPGWKPGEPLKPLLSDPPIDRDVETSLSYIVNADPTSDLPVARRRLVEIADIDQPLGYHGNYMIFPLRESNYLTTFMALQYMGAEMQIWDPDEIANFDIDQITRRLQELGTELDAATWAALKTEVQKKLSSARPKEETIVVPWDHLFVEALTGKHPLLEEFKLKHRAIDVEKVKSEVRAAELENLRMAARILSGEYEDPNIDRHVLIEGSGVAPVFPADGEA